MQSRIESPINRMILQDRRKITFHKLSSALSLIAGLDMIASAYTFEPMMQNSISSAHLTILGSWTTLFLTALVGLLGVVLSYSAYDFSRERYAKHGVLFVLAGIASIVFAMLSIGAYTQSTSLINLAQYPLGMVLALLGILFASKSTN